MKIGALYVIVKIVERCNLNCSYCYYYTAENSEVYGRDQLMRAERLEELLEYIATASAHGIGQVVFAFHGGEPTLAKAERVREFCDAAKARLGERLVVRFAVQTNAVHMSDGWLALIESEAMGVGVSIDGRREAHDKYRVDHRGHGSYDRVVGNLRTLLEIERRTPHVRVTALSVMGAEFGGVDFYRHLVEDLGLRHIKLLFVDRTNDEPLTESENTELGQKLCEMFDYWLAKHSRSVDVIPFDRIVRGVTRRLTGGAPAQGAFDFGMAVLSDGRVRLPDDFMIAKDWFWSQATLSLAESTVSEFMSQPHVAELQRQMVSAPTRCGGCAHVAACQGGELAHRYQRGSGFDNPSVYCGPLKTLYSHVEMRLAAPAAEVLQRRRLASPVDEAALS